MEPVNSKPNSDQQTTPAVTKDVIAIVKEAFRSAYVEQLMQEISEKYVDQPMKEKAKQSELRIVVEITEDENTLKLINSLKDTFETEVLIEPSNDNEENTIELCFVSEISEDENTDKHFDAFLDTFETEVLIETLNDDKQNSQVEAEERVIDSLLREIKLAKMTLSEQLKLVQNNEIVQPNALERIQLEVFYDFMMQSGPSIMTAIIKPMNQIFSKLGGVDIEPDLLKEDDKFRQYFEHIKSVIEEAIQYILADSALLSQVLEEGISPNLAGQLVMKAKKKLYSPDDFKNAEELKSSATIAYLQKVKEILNEKCSFLGCSFSGEIAQIINN